MVTSEPPSNLSLLRYAVTGVALPPSFMAFMAEGYLTLYSIPVLTATGLKLSMVGEQAAVLVQAGIWTTLAFHALIAPIPTKQRIACIVFHTVVAAAWFSVCVASGSDWVINGGLSQGINFRAAGALYALFAPTVVAYALSDPARRPPLAVLWKIVLAVAALIPLLFLVPVIDLCLRWCCCCGPCSRTAAAGKTSRKGRQAGDAAVAVVLCFVGAMWAFMALNGALFYYLDKDWRSAALFNMGAVLAAGVVAKVSFRRDSRAEEGDGEPSAAAASTPGNSGGGRLRLLRKLKNTYSSLFGMEGKYVRAKLIALNIGEGLLQGLTIALGTTVISGTTVVRSYVLLLNAVLIFPPLFFAKTRAYYRDVPMLIEIPFDLLNTLLACADGGVVASLLNPLSGQTVGFAQVVAAVYPMAMLLVTSLQLCTAIQRAGAAESQDGKRKSVFRLEMIERKATERLGDLVAVKHQGK